MRLRVGLLRSTSFSPATLFSAGEVGAWYDPSDLTTLFTDTAGTTPVTTPGQTVALMLDKSRGLTPGPELVTNGDFSGGSTGWTLQGTATISGGVAAINSSSASDRVVTSGNVLPVGKFARVEFDLSVTSGGVNFQDTLGGNTNVFTTSGRKSLIAFSSSAAGIQFFRNAVSGSFNGTIDNISVREIPGNHATQATTLSRPTYAIEPMTGRRNLLTWSEDQSNGIWVKANVTIPATQYLAPDGTTTAELMYPASSGSNRFSYQVLSSPSGIYTGSVYAKAAGKNFLCLDITGGGASAYFDLAAGSVGTVSAGYTASIQSVGNGWHRCSIRNTSNSALSFAGVYSVTDADNSRAVTANGTDGILLWGGQFETGSIATPYQRVTTQFDVTEAGVASKSYLFFDGSDDFMLTGTITPGVDKAQVFAGVRKLSDAAAVVAELSNNINNNNGAIALFTTGYGASGARWGLVSAGTILRNADTATNYAAPITNVLTGIGDISGDNSALRANGAQVAQNTGDQGTGNYLAYPLYIGRRGGAALSLWGNLYGLITRFSAANLDAATITSTETWMNQRTGAY